MAKHLLILRHGHAEQQLPASGEGDVERPLRSKGRRLVTTLSPVVQSAGLDLVLSSPSRRTRQTVDALLLTAPVEWLEPLYGADADELLDAVRELSAREEPPESVLLVGHNPGVHQLVLELTGGEQLPGFPPASLAWLDLDIDEWWQASTGSGRLRSLHLPEDPHD